MKLSVLMITYNHERFIAQAIESVLAQKTSFDWELVIGEDCSTDNTRAIVEEYASRYPGKIRPLFRERNLGVMPNFVDTYAQCRGEYIAFLEGDDWWTDDRKLLKQIEAMDAHLSWTFSFHQVQAAVEGETELPGHYQLNSGIYPSDLGKTEIDVDELLLRNPVQTCSLIVRRSAMPVAPEWLTALSLGDWPICILLAARGQGGFVRENMACYRMHGGGVWSLASEERRLNATIKMFEAVGRNVPGLELPKIRKKLGQLHRQLAVCYLREWRGLSFLAEALRSVGL